MKKFLLILFFFIPFASFAQNYSDAQIKAAYIYKFLINIEWPEEDNMSEFKICVFGNDTTIVPSLQSLAKTKKIRNIPIKIYIIEEFDDVLSLSPQAIYIPDNNIFSLKTVYYEILTRPILLITDSKTQILYVMLNFKVSNDNKIGFDLNTKNIEDQGLTILPKLTVLGGTELQVRELYKLKEEELQKEREIIKQMEIKLLQQQSLIDSQLVEIQKQNFLINSRKKSIDSLLNEIVSQKSILDIQSKELEKLQINIKKQQNLLSQKVMELNSQQDSIIAQKDLIAQQQSEINEKLAKLDDLNNDIATRETEIENQKNELSDLHGTINNQRLGLWLLVIILALVVLVVFFIYKNVKQKKRLNDKLIQKNNEVESQSEELQQINSELVTQKNQIQQQNDYITASIYSSKRLQSAMLPSFKGLRANFDVLLIFKPKDIVSGDFYWGAEVHSKDYNYKFIACVDCTGHGVPGALLSIVGSRLLTEIVKQHNIYEPSSILSTLNLTVKRILKQDNNKTITNEGMDLSLCRIEQKTTGFEIIFSGAKQSIFYYNNIKKETTRIKGSRLSIGGLYQKKDINFKSNTFEVKSGDAIYMPTDGYIDQNNENRKRFGSPRFTKLITKIGKLSASEQQKNMEQTLKQWQNNELQRDDITVLGIRIK